MFGAAATASDPKASYDVYADNIYRGQKPGTRGYASKPDSVTVAPTGLNNDLVITSKGVRPKVGAIRVQYGVVGPTWPVARLYEGGTPATLALAPSQGYQLVTTFPGTRGNILSLTVVDPGVPSSLSIRAVPTGDIVVRLARDGSAVTTTATDLVNLINATPGVNRWVSAWISDATKTSPLTALSKQFFLGGSDDRYLSYLAVATDSSSVVTTTALQVIAALAGSKLVSAALSGTDTGAVAVTAMGPVPLVGGILSGGAILASDARYLDEYRLDHKLGQGGAGTQNNYGLQTPAGRQGAPRTWKVVPSADRAVIASSTINHAMEHKPRSLFL